MEKIAPQIEESWKKVLMSQFQSPYFAQLKHHLIAEKEKYTIYPPGNLIFKAFDTLPFDEVKVVIIGQDPYHGPRQANGLCFSVSQGITPPPSLKNIYKELKDDLGIDIPTHGDLTRWAEQGVLLLNAALTVRAHQPLSHQKIGWEQFTDFVITQLSEQREGIIFLLWGRFAQNKENLINSNKHHILKAPHPSPLSASRGFFGCKHFSKVNDILLQEGKNAIDWQV